MNREQEHIEWPLPVITIHFAKARHSACLEAGRDTSIASNYLKLVRFFGTSCNGLDWIHSLTTADLRQECTAVCGQSFPDGAQDVVNN